MSSKKIKTKYDVVIGLEVHVQLASQTKIFCGCATKFGQAPNSQVCPICAGLPGVLPVLNRRVFELGLRAAVALNAAIAETIKFDRKNYFYPDLPKGYQISQFDKPIGGRGFLDVTLPEGERRIGITRAHLEEDAGKLIHDREATASLVDLNRAGVPLLEIVSEPEMKSPDEAYAYLVALKALVKAIGVSEVNMEMGHLRCDANVSLRESSTHALGTKVEIKNLNSFRYVRAALEYEIKRQAKLLDEGAQIDQETRLWHQELSKTMPMRSKEEAHDYRYFPEPDLLPFSVEPSLIEATKRNMPELPKARASKFKEVYGLNDYDTQLLLEDDAMTAFFKDLAKGYPNYKTLTNWIMGPIMAYMNDRRLTFTTLKIERASFIALLKLVDESRLSFKAAKDVVFPELMKTGDAPEKIMQRLNLTQISDKGALIDVIERVIDRNPKSVSDFKSGKEPALMFLVGQVMRETRGKANPNLVNQMIREELKK